MNWFSDKLHEFNEEIRQLILRGKVEICGCCDGLSAYSNIDVKDKIVLIKNVFELDSWECGHCDTIFTERAS